MKQPTKTYIYDFLLILFMFILLFCGWVLNDCFNGYFNKVAVERYSPMDRIQYDQIHVLQNQVKIDVNNTIILNLADTNSMDGMFDAGNNLLLIKVKNESDVIPGDIIAFYNDNYLIVHKVIEIGYDNKGWYAITSGVNLTKPDPGKRRINDINSVVYAIIY